MRQLVPLLVAGLLACGEENPSLDTCVQDRVTIEQGIYGQIIDSCDTEDCTMTYAAGREIRVYDKDPTPPDQPPEWGLSDQQTMETPIRKVTSVEEGFYQVPLETGVYYVCAIRCERMAITSTEPLARWDCCSAPGGDWWQGAECSAP